MSNNNQTLRAAFVSASFYPYIGGAEVLCQELAVMLAQKNTDVTVYTRRLMPSHAKTEIINGVEINRLFNAGAGAFNSLTFFVSLFCKLITDRKKYQIIHAHLGGSPALAAALAGRLLKKRVIITIGGGRGVGEIAGSKKTFLGKLKLWLLPKLRPVLVIVAKDILAEFEGTNLAKLKTVLIYNGIDANKFSPPSPSEKQLNKLNLGFDGKFIFVFVGRLVNIKRVPELVAAFARTCQMLNTVNAHLLIVGSGEEEAEIKNTVKTFSIQNQVHMIGYADTASNETLKYYRAADAFILPSASEGLSVSMLEAMACGLAAVVTKNGGAGEAITNGVNGILVDPFNEHEIINAIKALVTTPGLAQTLGDNARAQIMQNFALDKVADTYIKLYRGQI